MDAVAAFEAALKGLATKDLDDEHASAPSQPEPERSASAPKSIADPKPEALPKEDILMSALISAGIAPSSLSQPPTSLAPVRSTPVIHSTHSLGASTLKVIRTNGNKVVRITTAEEPLRTENVASPRMASQLIQKLPGGVSCNLNNMQQARLPTIIRKRPNSEEAAFPPVKFFRRDLNLTAQSTHSEGSQDTSQNRVVFNSQRFSQTPVYPPYTTITKVPFLRDDDVDEDDTDDLAQAETYAEYMPAKLRLGCKHPDPIVESSTLSSVSSPDVHYTVHLPQEVIDGGLLSSLQLEAVVYASQRHQCILPNGQRAGFLIGDGAGVGKGRTIAGIIYENYLQRRKKAIWLSVSNDLRVDAERDLCDVGLGRVKVHSLNKFRYARISGKANGRVKKGVLFSTYSSLIGESQGSAKAKYKTRLKQIVHWCGKDFDGVIVFDECHRAKNLTPSGSQKPTKTGLTVLELQNRLPNARIVYASATGATEPRNMAYMTRLGLWGEGTPFPTFISFIQTLERRGVGGMELVAMDMKLRGMYIARQLSFQGVNFTIQPVEIEHVELNNERFINVYNQSADLWVYAYRFFSEACRILNPSDKFRKTMWGQFWSAHQRFFKYLCIAAKVDACVKLTRNALAQGKCVVIGLQSTGEAKTLEQVEEQGSDLGEFVSTAKGVFQSLVEKYFPTKATLENFTARGDKLASAGDRSSSTTLSRAGRAVAGGQGSGLGLKDILGEKMLAKLIAGGSLSAFDEEEASLGKKVDSKADDSDDDEDDDDDDSAVDSDDVESTNTKNKTGGGQAGSSSSDYYDSDLELTHSSTADRVPKRPKKESIKSSVTRSKRKQKYSNESGSNSDSEGDWDLDAMCDNFLARHPGATKVDINSADVAAPERLKQNSLWADDSTSELSTKYLFGRSGLALENEPLSAPTDSIPIEEARRQCAEMQSLILRYIEKLGKYLPPSSLDDLIEKLGGPSRVAEMTGRRGRVIVDESGRILYESRRESDVTLEVINLAEKQRFMDGEKLIAIVSEAASSGISLQADRRVANQRRRVHITLELPWSADRAIQQFGRTHRSNQVSSPEYIFLISDLAGEQRFASTVAKRLESLGALTHGDRRATETRDLSRFNIDTKLGREALDIVLKACIYGDEGIVDPPADYRSTDTPAAEDSSEILPLHVRRHHQFFADVKAGLQGVGLFNGRSRERDSNHMSKFLNRLLGMRVHVQNALFRYFSDTLEELVRRAKRDNRLDLGIMDLGTTGQNLEIVWTKSFDTRFLSDSTQIHLHKVTTQRGVSWSAAMEIYTQHDGDADGFYMPRQNSGIRSMPLLAFYIKNRMNRNSGTKLYRIYRPNTGMQTVPMEYDKLKERYTRVSSPSDCQELWATVYKDSATKCIHLIQRNYCSRIAQQKALGLTPLCEVGLRARTYYVLSGSVLNVWARIEPLLLSRMVHSRCMQVVRLKPKDGKRIVGSLIPHECVDDVLSCLSHLQEDTELRTSTPFESPGSSPFSESPFGYPKVSKMGKLQHSYSTSSLASGQPYALTNGLGKSIRHPSNGPLVRQPGMVFGATRSNPPFPRSQPNNSLMYSSIGPGSHNISTGLKKFPSHTLSNQSFSPHRSYEQQHTNRLHHLYRSPSSGVTGSRLLAAITDPSNVGFAPRHVTPILTPVGVPSTTRPPMNQVAFTLPGVQMTNFSPNQAGLGRPNWASQPGNLYSTQTNGFKAAVPPPPNGNIPTRLAVPPPSSGQHNPAQAKRPPNKFKKVKLVWKDG
ncbi:unnamed protein product [Schistocephalus solidus]|nr:unnamed protein product [Schistocephalus solidus]